MPLQKRLIIIDGNSLVHRAYHALPPLKTKKGELVNALYGFLLVFLKILRELKPDFVAAAFDLPGPTFRHKKFKEYKAKRPPAPQELYQQIEKVKEVLRVFNIPIFEKQGFEADDLIGTISRQVAKKQIYPEIENIILSGDLDNLQLINKNTKVYTFKKGIKDTILYNVEKVKERYQGLEPCQLTDFKALRGDPSDNIPGVTGIGEKGAIQLIKKFGTLENLYKELAQDSEKSREIKESTRRKLKEYKEQAFISKSLVQMECNIPIDFRLEDCRFGKFDKEKIIEIFKNFEFYTLIERLTENRNQSNLFSLKSTGNLEPKEKILAEIERLYQEGVFSKKIYQIEKELVPIIEKMEENGIKIDLSSLKKLSKNLDIRIQDLTSKIYKLVGIEFNLNSPQQVSEILFKKLKISVDRIKKTPKGSISINSQELRKLRGVHPIIGLILEYREFFKLKSGFVDKLVKLINPKDKKIHPLFHQLGTETGRMSCSEPNLQNIPIKGELGKEIRKCFVAEPGYKFLSADYSQMELRIAAALSQDEKMLELFKKGEDIHQMTAVQIFGLSKEKITKEKRDFAKTLNYAIFYGMGKRSFGQRAGISQEKAEEFIKKYFDSFKELAQYVGYSVKTAAEKGFAETLFGRKRFLPEINSIDPRLKAQAERIATNMPIQGSSADIVKMAMVELKEKGIIEGDCKLILQIHDELLFEIKEDKIKEAALEIKKIMENVVKLNVPLKVDLRVGSNWKELEIIVE